MTAGNTAAFCVGGRSLPAARKEPAGRKTWERPPGSQVSLVFRFLDQKASELDVPAPAEVNELVPRTSRKVKSYHLAVLRHSQVLEIPQQVRFRNLENVEGYSRYLLAKQVNSLTVFLLQRRHRQVEPPSRAPCPRLVKRVEPGNRDVTVGDSRQLSLKETQSSTPPFSYASLHWSPALIPWFASRPATLGKTWGKPANLRTLHRFRRRPMLRDLPSLACRLAWARNHDSCQAWHEIILRP